MRRFFRKFPLASPGLALVALAGFAFFAHSAVAQTPDPYGLTASNTSGFSTADVRVIAGNIIKGFLGLLGLVAVVLNIYAGFLWMTAKGDEAQVTKAKAILKNGVIGLIIILLSYSIAAFILGAIGDATNGASSSCPPGQVCGNSGGGRVVLGGKRDIRITGTMPAGAGPGNGGWPKNYSIAVGFNTQLKPDTDYSSHIYVRKCNSRLGVTGAPQPFVDTDCVPVAGTVTSEGNVLRFKPVAKNAAGVDGPVDFDGENWYAVRVQSGAMTDLSGEARELTCPLQTIDISLPTAGEDYCERAIAFNDKRDVEPPTIELSAPASPPAYCATAAFRTLPVWAVAKDDFLVASVNFLLDGTTKYLQNDIGAPFASSSNGKLRNPFVTGGVRVDISALEPGQHAMSAVAKDGVPQSSASVEGAFSIKPGQCCNKIKDDGETDVDCGSAACGACTGTACTTGADCASGFCDPATKQCQARPVILEVETDADSGAASGGPGTYVTIRGTGFGSGGNVIFLGVDKDGDGDALDQGASSDDVSVAACDPAAWKETEVVVSVPTGAATGPVKIVTVSGPSDRSDDDFGPPIPAFSVTTETNPGICYLQPSTGAAGSKFAIRGAGFGAASGSSFASFGPYALTIAGCAAGSQECGWSDTTIWAVTPPLAENAYQVSVSASGKLSNTSTFVLRANPNAARPQVTAVIPESGPVGSYVTIQGTGFGNAKGSVQFLFGNATDPAVAIADEPVCDDNWHDNYIIVKVPVGYGGPQAATAPANALKVSAQGIAHAIKVVTALPTKDSNTNVVFKTTNEAPRPGVCAVTPDNGPPGVPIVVKGEGFGAGPVAGVLPRFSVDFFKSSAKYCLNSPNKSQPIPCSTVGQICANPAHGVCAYASVSPSGYTWSGVQIATVVAGSSAKFCSINKTVACSEVGKPCPNAADGICSLNTAGWPASGPVYVVSNNRLSTNAIPFTVQDCNAGVACEEGEQCCANGSCQAYCGPVSRDSAYGWRFSTEVLPTLPQVVERAQCSLDGANTVFQSPSPYKGAVDACINSMFFVEFTHYLSKASFTSAAVTIEECGQGVTMGTSCTAVPHAAFTTTGTFANCDPSDQSGCKTFQTAPASNYNGGRFKSDTWYRVTLLSRPPLGQNPGVGLFESGNGARYLDGDRDRVAGGDYVTTFHVKNSTAPCEVANIAVNAPKQLIEDNSSQVGFNAMLMDGNCALLQCQTGSGTSLAWTGEDAYLTRISPTNACTQTVTAVSETPSTLLELQLTQTNAAGGSASKQAESDVTVAFADPRVTRMLPSASCESACVNANIGANFNIPMDVDSLDEATIKLYKCRNAACNPPYAADLDGATAKVNVPTGFNNKRFRISLGSGKNLQPNTYYTVRIKGKDGARSASGVPLTGLNDGDWFSWKFKTKNDTSLCAVAATEVSPKSAILPNEGARAQFSADAFGSPDDCEPEGQELNPYGYSWVWSFDDPNSFLNGFVSLSSSYTKDTQVDTSTEKVLGCTDRCVLTGSQNSAAQCGNGVLESKFEECEPKICSAGPEMGKPCLADEQCPGGGSCQDDALCNDQCLFSGASGSCGDGEVGPGESCDRVPDPENANAQVFPPGCGSGEFDACLMTGSSVATGSKCGNGQIEDGEVCDDGNTATGDGCNAVCLKEGSLRSCVGAAKGVACVNFCGNGITEPGEDPNCDSATAKPSAAGCSPVTCLKLGTNTCVNRQGAGCCGNGEVEKGEDEECETGDGVAEFCTDRCIRKGSSSLYSSPSFCGDGVEGPGEYGACEVGMDADDLIDPMQSIEVALQEGKSPAVSFLRATVASGAGVLAVPTDKQGRASVDMVRCVDNTQCESGFQCSVDGICVVEPKARIFPVSYNACRNAQVKVIFSELMNPATVASNLLVGVDRGNNGCPTGSTEVEPKKLSSAGGFWKRVWGSVVDFVQAYVLRPVFGAPPAVPTAVEQGHRFCSVRGTVSVVPDGPPGAEYSIAYFDVESALPANKYIRVRLEPGMKSAKGTSIPAAGVTHYFATGAEICAIQKVQVVPASVLLQTPTATHAVVAQAVGRTGESIVPTTEYLWRWQWSQVASTQPVVLVPRETNNTPCTLEVACENAAKCDCVNYAGTCKVDKDALSCAIKTTAQRPVADVYVRGGDPTRGSEVSYTPKNTTDEVPLEAVAVIENWAGDFVNVSSLETTDSGHATVMLCAEPWPAYQKCDLATGKITPPWDTDPAHRVNCTADTWLPFKDTQGTTATKVQLQYCRDVQQAGAEEEPLPCLAQAPARIAQVGPGILHEYLFTFDTDTETCPNRPKLKGAQWRDDAVGLRISLNTEHVSVAQWYRDRGFRGTPTPTTVDGYDALQEGRTVYVNAAIKNAQKKLYTNVNTLSYSEGGSPETVAIFNQLLKGIDFNGTTDLADIGLCRSTASRSSAILKCATNDDCRRDAAGRLVPGRTYTCNKATFTCQDNGLDVAGVGVGIACDKDLDCPVADGCQIKGNISGSGSKRYHYPGCPSYDATQIDLPGEKMFCTEAEAVAAGWTKAGNCATAFTPVVGACDVPKTKLIRDVRRWADLQALRARVLSVRTSKGTVPRLDAGSFIRGQSVSIWPSWNAQFATELASAPPVDPINKLGDCGCRLEQKCTTEGGCDCARADLTCKVKKDDVSCQPDGVDPATCWNASKGTFYTPTKSNVYIYKTYGNADFSAAATFEYAGAGNGSAWAGGTCVEKGTQLSDCRAASACTVTCAGGTSEGASCVTDTDCPGSTCTGRCNYKEGKIEISSAVGPFSATSGAIEATGAVGRCGDGVVNTGEDCEVGQVKAADCRMKVGDFTYDGKQQQYCTSSCTWAVRVVPTAQSASGDFAFDETVSTAGFTDSSGTIAKLTCAGAACPTAGVAGKFGKAVQFNGTSQVLTVAKGLNGALDGTASMAFWIKTTQRANALSGKTFSVPWQSPGITGVEKPSSGDDVFWGFLDDDGRIGIQAGGFTVDSTAAKSNSAINDDAWHHVVLTRDATTRVVQVFVDGVLQTRTAKLTGANNESISTNAAVSGATNPLEMPAFASIGKIEGSSNPFFRGSLDELSIFPGLVLDQESAQRLMADTGIASPCVVGRCGDGAVQSPEVCDDGSSNGDYGFCNATCNGSGSACGDGTVQPGESCDCGRKNGEYAFNGVVATSSSCGASDTTNASTSVNTCAWNCSGAGPHCGDGVITDGEACDGNAEEFKGYCDGGSRGGQGCNADGECPGGACGNFCDFPEQRRRRTCRPNSATSSSSNERACTWNVWGCTAPGTCGNGVKESNEECDDGNEDDTDGCIRNCKLAYCGDAKVYPAGAEQCDLGTPATAGQAGKNGTVCSPRYDQSCNYCTNQCKLSSKTGPFCGDGTKQDEGFDPPGPEQCDKEIGSEWICVHTGGWQQSYGYKDGTPTCKDCLRHCTSPTAELCEEDGYDSDSPDDGLKDNCDPDDDNDGVPDSYDCDPKDKTIHPAYKLHDRNIPIATEICDGVDNDCDGRIDEKIDIGGKVTNVRTNKGLASETVQVKCGAHVLASTTTNGSGNWSIVQDDVAVENCIGGQVRVQLADASGEYCPQGTYRAADYRSDLCINIANYNISNNRLSSDIQNDRPNDPGYTFKDFYPIELTVAKKPQKGQYVSTISWDSSKLSDIDYRVRISDHHTTKGDSGADKRFILAYDGGANGRKAGLTFDGNVSCTKEQLETIRTANDVSVTDTNYPKRCIDDIDYGPTNKADDDKHYVYVLDVDATGGNASRETVTVNMRPGVVYSNRLWDYSDGNSRGNDMEKAGLRMQAWAMTPNGECTYYFADANVIGSPQRGACAFKTQLGQYRRRQDPKDDHWYDEWPFFKCSGGDDEVPYFYTNDLDELVSNAPSCDVNDGGNCPDKP